MIIKVHPVKEIEKDPSGKFRFVVNNVEKNKKASTHSFK